MLAKNEALQRRASERPLVGCYEWAYRFSYNSSAEREHWLSPYLHFYNFHRAHSALSYNAPISRLDRKNVPRRNS